VEQTDLLRLAVITLERLRIPYMLVGSYASSVWGEARFTQDIDILVDLRLDRVAELCAAFPVPEFYFSEQAARDAVRLRSQFNVIHPPSGNKIDFMLPRGDDWSLEQLGRYRTEQFEGGIAVQVASPEDVIVSKMIYYNEGGSEKHLRDCAGILRVQEGRIELDYIAKWAQRFRLIDVWNVILERVKED